MHIRKLAYAAGWKITSSDNRDDQRCPLVEIKFMKGNEVLASIDCMSDQFLPGQTTSVNCFGTEPKPKGYDRITINDTFLGGLRSINPWVCRVPGLGAYVQGRSHPEVLPRIKLAGDRRSERCRRP